MKHRCLAWILILALTIIILPATVRASEEGEMLLTSEPVEGAVGEIVAVDFYCYPNLPEGLLLDSLEGTLLYDAEFLTLGSINLRDEEKNLSSLMNSKGPIWIPNTTEAGKLQFAYADTFGTDEQGFLFQIEFRIEKEGATAFVFNSIRYSGLDTTTNKATSFFINPRQTGGVKTEGQEIPGDVAADTTYAPLEPNVETPAAKSTPTPLPSNNGQPVPNTTQLPEPTNIATPSSGLVTPNPKVTSMPANTSSATEQATAPASEAPATQGTEPTDTEVPTEATQEPEAPIEATAEPLVVSESTPKPNEGTNVQPTSSPENVKPAQQQNKAVLIAVIAGIIVVILLAILAIILVLIRKKRMDEEE